MGNTNASKQIFAKLDKDGNGIVNLSEIVENKEQDDVTSVCSLPTLYYFDFSKKGELNFKEFVEMEKFVQKVQKKVKAQKPTTEEFIYKVREDDSETDAHDDHPETPKTPHEKSSSIIPICSPKQGGLRRVASDDDFFKQKEIKKQISIALQPSFDEIFDQEAGRTQFLEWLFKLSDIKKTNNISFHELQILLSAVKNDEIDLETLVFTEDEDNKKTDVVQRIMKEYDQNNQGVLSKAEFMKLGDLILSKYEARYKDTTEEQMVGEWKLTHTLGEGSYGIVKLAQHVETKTKRAVKKIKRGTVSDMSKLDVEITAMKILKHPNVVQLYEVIEDSNFIYLVMELCGGGSLYEYLKDNPFEEGLARYYFTKLIDGLSYCHDMGICHRDLRVQNMLLDNLGNLKISDFGHAGIFKKGWDIFSTQLVGSLYHLSPEQINGKAYSGEKIDIWNAGIILYYFLTSRLPFCSGDVMEMFNDIKNAKYTYPTDINVPEDAKDLISQMLRVNPKDRITLTQVKQHKWFTGAQKKPTLSIHNLQLIIKGKEKITDNLNALQNLLENVLQSVEDIHVLKCIKPAPSTGDPSQPVAVPNIFLKAVMHKDQVLMAFKCIEASKNIKFIFYVGISSNNIVLEYQLNEGEIIDYNGVVSQLDKAITCALKSVK